jgi:ribosome recycling factor
MTTANMNSVKEVEANLKTRMEKSLADLQHEMASIRTGRATLSILDHIRVDYYGTPTPLNQLANLHVPEPALITVQPWDVSQIGPIEKAIRASDLGLNPANDGKLIRLPIPPLTEERRKEIVKRLHHLAEDEDKRAHDEIQKLTDSYMLKLEQAVKTKEKEILEIR